MPNKGTRAEMTQSCLAEPTSTTMRCLSVVTRKSRLRCSQEMRENPFGLCDRLGYKAWQARWGCRQGAQLWAGCRLVDRLGRMSPGNKQAPWPLLALQSADFAESFTTSPRDITLRHGRQGGSWSANLRMTRNHTGLHPAQRGLSTGGDCDAHRHIAHPRPLLHGKCCIVVVCSCCCGCCCSCCLQSSQS